MSMLNKKTVSIYQNLKLITRKGIPRKHQKQKLQKIDKRVINIWLRTWSMLKHLYRSLTEIQDQLNHMKTSLLRNLQISPNSLICTLQFLQKLLEVKSLKMKTYSPYRFLPLKTQLEVRADYHIKHTLLTSMSMNRSHNVMIKYQHHQSTSNLKRSNNKQRPQKHKNILDNSQMLITCYTTKEVHKIIFYPNTKGKQKINYL